MYVQNDSSITYIELKTQSYNQCITKLERTIFAKTERETIYEAQPNGNTCKHKIAQSHMQLDNIQALANGGNHEMTSIQGLCLA